MGMFFEGCINCSDEFMKSVRFGVVMIVLMVGVFLVFCYIEGSLFDGFLLGVLLMFV